MRAIKFRGKRIDNSEWVFGGISVFENEATIYDCNCIVNSAYDVELDSVGEFSGLLDKNNIEIYEGDNVIAREFNNEGMSKLNIDDNLEIFSLDELKGNLEVQFDSKVIFDDGEFYVQVPNNGTIIPLCCFFGNQKHSQPIFEIEVKSI